MDGKNELPQGFSRITPSYLEDSFDVGETKKDLTQNTKKVVRYKKNIKKVALYRVIIMVLAFIIAYWLYHLANDLIMQLEYNRYHSGHAPTVIQML